MKKSIKAALLSGLVFPGIGHLVVKAYWRALALIAVSLTATYVIFDIAMKQAMAVVDNISSGAIPADADALSELIAQSANSSDDATSNICLIIIGACWVIGIIDSYRLGAAQEK